MYMIPFGLTLAYSDLCEKTGNKNLILSEWMKPFRGFRRLINFTMLGAAVYAVFPPVIWGTTGQQSSASRWSRFIPYTSIAIDLVPAVLLPHYFFHKLFSNAKDKRLDELGEEISQAPIDTQASLLRRIALLLEKGEVRELKTWLLEVKTIGEITVAALVHIILVEALTAFLHS